MTTEQTIQLIHNLAYKLSNNNPDSEVDEEIVNLLIILEEKIDDSIAY